MTSKEVLQRNAKIGTHYLKLKEFFTQLPFLKRLKELKKTQAEKRENKMYFKIYRKRIKAAAKEAGKSLAKGNAPENSILSCKLDKKAIFLAALAKEGVSETLESITETFIDTGAASPHFYEIVLNWNNANKDR